MNSKLNYLIKMEKGNNIVISRQLTYVICFVVAVVSLYLVSIPLVKGTFFSLLLAELQHVRTFCALQPPWQTAGDKAWSLWRVGQLLRPIVSCSRHGCKVGVNFPGEERGEGDSIFFTILSHY